MKASEVQATDHAESMLQHLDELSRRHRDNVDIVELVIEDFKRYIQALQETVNGNL